MPELPDVEVMRRYFQSTALHKKITAVDVNAERIIPNEDAPEARVLKQLKDATVGHTFASTRRHGKWMFAALNEDSDQSLVFHFGMTGGLHYFKDMSDEPEYTQVLFSFANDYHLAYLSQRKLGEIEVIDSVDQFIKEKDLGPDVYDPDFDLEAFKKAVDHKRAMIKTTLMNQSIMAGIGNVYSDEILYQAGVYPRAKINDLSEDKLEEIFHKMKKVLQTAIDHQAEPQDFPENFITPHRHGDGHCPRCGAEIEKVQVGSRHAYYCPNRQPKKED